MIIIESSIYLWHESHKEFGAQFTVIISVTVNAVHCHRREGVKSTSPGTENHNKNGYVNYTTFTRTSSRPMRTTIMTQSTPSTMTRTITTRAICTSEHSTAPLVVFLVLMLSHDPLGSSRSCVRHSICMSSMMCGSL